MCLIVSRFLPIQSASPVELIKYQMHYLQLTFETFLWRAQIRNQEHGLPTEQFSSLARSLIQSYIFYHI